MPPRKASIKNAEDMIPFTTATTIKATKPRASTLVPSTTTPPPTVLPVPISASNPLHTALELENHTSSIEVEDEFTILEKMVQFTDTYHDDPLTAVLSCSPPLYTDPFQSSNLAYIINDQPDQEHFSFAHFPAPPSANDSLPPFFPPFSASPSLAEYSKPLQHIKPSASMFIHEFSEISRRNELSLPFSDNTRFSGALYLQLLTGAPCSDNGDATDDENEKSTKKRGRNTKVKGDEDLDNPSDAQKSSKRQRGVHGLPLSASNGTKTLQFTSLLLDRATSLKSLLLHPAVYPLLPTSQKLTLSNINEESPLRTHHDQSKIRYSSFPGFFGKNNDIISILPSIATPLYSIQAQYQPKLQVNAKKTYADFTAQFVSHLQDVTNSSITTTSDFPVITALSNLARHGIPHDSQAHYLALLRDIEASTPAFPHATNYAVLPPTLHSQLFQAPSLLSLPCHSNTHNIPTVAIHRFDSQHDGNIASLHQLSNKFLYVLQTINIQQTLPMSASSLAIATPYSCTLLMLGTKLNLGKQGKRRLYDITNSLEGSGVIIKYTLPTPPNPADALNYTDPTRPPMLTAVNSGYILTSLESGTTVVQYVGKRLVPIKREMFEGILTNTAVCVQSNDFYHVMKSNSLLSALLEEKQNDDKIVETNKRENPHKNTVAHVFNFLQNNSQSEHALGNVNSHNDENNDMVMADTLSSQTKKTQYMIQNQRVGVIDWFISPTTPHNQLEIANRSVDYHKRHVRPQFDLDVIDKITKNYDNESNLQFNDCYVTKPPKLAKDSSKKLRLKKTSNYDIDDDELLSLLAPGIVG